MPHKYTLVVIFAATSLFAADGEVKTQNFFEAFAHARGLEFKNADVTEGQKDKPLPNPRKNQQFQSLPVVIPNGSFVIIKKGAEVAAIHIDSQSSSPSEGCTFKWLYRNDGIIDFAPNAKGITEKVCSSTQSSRFGNLSVLWSSNAPGYGYIYLQPECYTGIVIGATQESLNDRLLGLPMISNLKGDRLDLHPPES